MLTIKILFTINSLKKTILSKDYLQFLSLKKCLVLIRKKLITLLKQKLFKLRQSLKKITKKGEIK